MTLLGQLLQSALGEARTHRLFGELQVPTAMLTPPSASVSRALLAQALNMVLFDDLLDRVPVGRDYVDDVVAAGGRIHFDHGAVRTVLWSSGALPPGESSISRVLRPLGFGVAADYPLPKLRMTGRAWAHEDQPDTIAQFFVSELHPEAFSPKFQETVARVLESSIDPLDPLHIAWLEQLSRDRALPFEIAVKLLPVLVACFARHHGAVQLADYEALLSESAEMAWIATEGNAFNHATDRVADVEKVADAQRALGRPIKASVEVSRSGRVRQTAFRAAQVEREFLVGDEVVKRTVPGSFYEFITRAPVESGCAAKVDLSFDAGNATGIFGMTAAVAR